MMTLKEVLTKIRYTPQGKLTVWAGAGISVPSGLPTARPIIENLLSHLPIERNDIPLLLPRSGLALPFEAYMEVATENTLDSSILDLFALGTPNFNHHFLSFLLKNRHLTEIYTTNFDCLIEAAITANGCNVETDFVTFFNESDFYKVSNQYHKPAVVKIHGSIESRESVRATMIGIADHQLSASRFSLVRQIFSGDIYDTVLILGYSCSDYFDILPSIRSIKSSKCTVILIDHLEDKNDINIVNIADLPTDTFRDYSGIRIKVNTTVFMEELSKCYGFCCPSILLDTADWQSVVANWYSNIKKPHLPDSILGQLFYRASMAERALHYYSRALENATNAKDIRAQGAVINNMGLILQETGQHLSAANNFTLAHTFFSQVPDRIGIAASQANLGWALAYLNIDKSIHHSHTALSLAEESSFIHIKLNALNNLGLAYKRIGDFKKALTYYDEAMSIGSGDKRGEVTTLANIANAYYRLGDHLQSKRIIDKALRLAREIGYLAGQVRALRLLAIMNQVATTSSTSIDYEGEAQSLISTFNLTVPEIE